MIEPKVYLARIFSEICEELNLPLNLITNKQEVIGCMKLYSHIMCEKQKEICANNAEADYNIINTSERTTLFKEDNIEVYVLKQSIIQCKNATEI